MSKNGGWTIKVREYDLSVHVSLYLKLAVLDLTGEIPPANLTIIAEQLRNQLMRAYWGKYETIVYRDHKAFELLSLSPLRPEFQRTLEAHHANRTLSYTPEKPFYIVKDVDVVLGMKYRIVANHHFNSATSFVYNFPGEHVLEIRKSADTTTLADGNNVYGMVNKIGGTIVTIDRSDIDGMITGSNIKTLAHEFGHTLGLYHVDQFDSLEQHMDAHRQAIHSDNLMVSGSSIYSKQRQIQRSVIGSQIEAIIRAYRSGKLNLL